MSARGLRPPRRPGRCDRRWSPGRGPSVGTETWVPPASRQASISAVRPSTPIRGGITQSAPKSSAALPWPPRRSRRRFHASTTCSMLPPKKMKPSAEPGARSNAASPNPPSQIGMGCAGFGSSAALSTRWNRPEKSTRGSCEQLAQQLDLLLLPCAAGAEVLPEGLVLDVVPADPHAEAKSTAGQEIDIGRLPCHERGLALRQDQDPGGETDPLGDASEVGEHHERIVKRVVLGVAAGQRRRSIGVNGTEHVVVGEEVVEAEIFHRCADSANSVGSPRSSFCGYTTPICMR